jgi:hypothetical protein
MLTKGNILDLARESKPDRSGRSQSVSRDVIPESLEERNRHRGSRDGSVVMATTGGQEPISAWGS